MFYNTTNDVTDKDVIKIYIEDSNVKKTINDMVTAEKYYKGQNSAITNRQMKMYDKNTESFVTDNSKTNNKLVHSFLGDIIDSKLNYILGKPMTINCDNEQYLKDVKEVLGKRFQNKIYSVTKQACMKGIGWLYVHINGQGKLALTLIPSEQIIPLWYDSSCEELQAVIRQYQVETYEGTEQKVITKIEYYTENGVWYYLKDGNEIIVDAESYILNNDSNAHFTVNGEERVWGKVPFVFVKNNEEMLSDLAPIKSLIDAYDRVVSDVDNELEDIRNLIYILKGYINDGSEDLVRQLKYSRVVGIAEDGGLDVVQQPIDITSAKTHADMLKADIIRFSGSVDKDVANIGSNTSGTALKFLYSNLDIKCNQIELNVNIMIEDLMYFVNEYLRLLNKHVDEQAEIEVTLNRDVIFNELESIQMCQASMGVISEETILANHPWVTDVQAELEKINYDKTEISDMFPTDE